MQSREHTEQNSRIGNIGFGLCSEKTHNILVSDGFVVLDI